MKIQLKERWIRRNVWVSFKRCYHGTVSDLKIVAQQNKVCPQTEETIYTDQFFEEQNLVVNALDNVEARRYVDRYVTNNFSFSHNVFHSYIS